ncbi:MAG: class I SAM-dependent RNA methyltransferase [Proteobacteria bacterium]|nr:class I SAM-dependent RNA methyltransferase [Pseudomonadota bacterium]
MQLETIDIDKIVNGGYGLAHLATGQVILVRHVLPGETVIVAFDDNKKNTLFGQVQQIVTPHTTRRAPPCPYYGECGGCDLQHCEYAGQLQIKKGVFIDLIQRSNRQELKESLPLLAQPLPSPEEFGYRQRLRLQVEKGGMLGFHRFQSHSLIPITACMLAGATLNRALTSLRTEPDARKLTTLASEVELQENPSTGKTVVIFRLPRKPRPAETQAAQRFTINNDTVDRVFFTGEHFSLMGPYCGAKSGVSGNKFDKHYPALTGIPRDFHFSWEVGGFCQVNLKQNRYLIETVVDFCQVKKGQKILDLYCGMGNFAIPLAFLGAEVMGIEGQGSAIRSAKNNANRAGLVNVRFQQNPIHAACSDLLASGARFDCVVVDPPRQGAPGLAVVLTDLCLRRLVYISCDPATLCRDLVDLVDLGFSIRKIQQIDMFPQTHHIETVVLLEK